MKIHILIGMALLPILTSTVMAQDAVPTMPDVSMSAKAPSLSLDEPSQEEKAREAIKQLDLTQLGLTPEQLATMPPEEVLLLAVEDRMKKELARLDHLEPEIPSVFFDQSEHTQLRSVLGKSKLPTPDEQASASEAKDNDIALLSNELSGQRDISLSGILYHGAQDWTLWLNNQRLTPDRLPSQVKSIKVTKTFVELRWYDDVSKQIIPIRLRPSQRFNLDARMFFPG